MSSAGSRDDARRALLDGPVLGEEPLFLRDLPTDNLVGAIVALAAEVYILRERLQTLEAELVDRKTLPAGAVEQRTPSAEEQARRADDVARFTNRILSELARNRTPVSTIDPRVKDLLAPHERRSR